MRLGGSLHRLVAACVAAVLLVSCGSPDSSESRDRNVEATLTCAQGGPCVVGDTGPGGGVVVSVVEDEGMFAWEVAPLNGFGTHLEASVLVDDLEFGGVDDWQLPTDEVADFIFDRIEVFACPADTDCGSAFGAEAYWLMVSAGEVPAVVSFVDGSTTLAAADARHFIRPVRVFEVLPELEVDPVEDLGNPDFYTTTTPSVPETTTSTSTTSTTSTTTTAVVPRTCANGGECALGDTGPGGGVVFYVADKDFTSTGSDCGEKCRYMEITTTDQATFSPWILGVNACYGEGSDRGNQNCTWNNSIYSNSIGQGAARVNARKFGNGMANTNYIHSRMTEVAGQPANAYAAGVAWAYENNGVTDWFLPSQEELAEVFNARGRIPGITVNNSQSTSMYQSSTETTPFYSLVMTMSSGWSGNVNKHSTYRVRAVRAFGPRVVVSPSPSSTPGPTIPFDPQS